MLGRLIQGYGKSPTSLESTTDEAHSRSLLWPHNVFDHSRAFPSSPPSTPVSSPGFRVGPFDDRGGVEFNDTRDLRVVIAQDAFGSLDKQLVLFDSHKTGQDATVRRGQTPKVSPRDAHKTRNQQPISPLHQRNRSSTIAGPASAWARPTREPDADDKVHRLLECMFGNTSTTKSDSSTKMHILFAGSDSDSSPVTVNPSAARPPLSRALTSQTAAGNARSARPTREGSRERDVILITKMFAVPLPDSKESVPTRSKSGDDVGDVISPLSDDGGAKKTKLIEKKTPMYAVGLLVTLPQEEVRPSFSRPPSRMSLASSSFPNSMGSDFASSWTLLEAISDSFASSPGPSKQLDRRIDALTSSWDMILRALSDVESVAKAEIKTLLQMVNREVMSSMVKVPKGPNEQRTNQRNIYLTQQMALSRVGALDKSSRHFVQRLSTALRIPKVATGIGFRDGHWNDEARYVVHVCNSRSQNHFLLNLLTAFLGNHTEWLGTSTAKAPWKSQPSEEDDPALTRGSPRTVIVCDQRSLARRLIFLLASFLPTAAGASPFEQQTTPYKSPLPTPGLMSSSPLKHVRNADHEPSDTRRSSHSQHVTFGGTEATHLSTSVSSNTSASTHASMRLMRPQLERKQSDTASVRTASRFPVAGSSTHMRKTSAANSALTPQPVSTLPYMSTKQDGYFPDNAIAEGSDYGASDQLARILRRDSSSTTAARSSSGSWGFLGLWSRRTTPSGAPDESTDADERQRSHIGDASATPQRGVSKLESMVGEAVSVAIPQNNSQLRAFPGSESDSNAAYVEHDERPGWITNPRLKVNEEDGVVDVDIGLPGFLGWDGDDEPMSPKPQFRTNASGRSIDGVTSLRSSFSHAAPQAINSTMDEMNVAGYLRQYHEDFVLQAVRPYGDLVSEIKESMIRESLSLISKENSTNAEHTTNDGDWVDVSATNIVDVRKFTVERLTLRRKIGRSRVSEAHATPHIPDARPAVEHRFVSEPITEPDSMLAEAISGLLDISRKMSHSRSTSGTNASGTTTPIGTTSANIAAHPRMLRSNCRQAVADVLEQVVKSVSDDLDDHENGQLIATKTLSGSTKGKEAQEHNVLREGVKRWLAEAEPRNVW